MAYEAFSFSTKSTGSNFGTILKSFNPLHPRHTSVDAFAADDYTTSVRNGACVHNKQIFIVNHVLKAIEKCVFPFPR